MHGGYRGAARSVCVQKKKTRRLILCTYDSVSFFFFCCKYVRISLKRRRSDVGRVKTKNTKIKCLRTRGLQAFVKRQSFLFVMTWFSIVFEWRSRDTFFQVGGWKQNSFAGAAFVLLVGVATSLFGVGHSFGWVTAGSTFIFDVTFVQAVWIAYENSARFCRASKNQRVLNFCKISYLARNVFCKLQIKSYLRFELRVKISIS